MIVNTVNRKLVPHRTCAVVKRCADSGVSGHVVLVGGDRLVLGAVVLEDLLDLGHSTDEEEVPEEDREHQHALDDMESEAIDAGDIGDSSRAERREVR